VSEPDSQKPAIDERAPEFRDYTGPVVPFEGDLGWSRLLNPPALRGFIALIGGTLFLVLDRSDELLAVIVGIGAIGWGLAGLAGRGSQSWPNRIAAAFVLVGGGVALLAWPEVTRNVIARLLSVAIALNAVRAIVPGIAPDAEGKRHWWPLIRGGFTITIAVALWVFPELFLNLFIGLFAGFWVVTGLATVLVNLTSPTGDVEFFEIWPSLFEWLEARPQTADDRSQLYAKLFYEGDLAARRLSRFFLLMGFATTIATFGIITDSTAVVIGAMLVAPLMTPLMGTSLSLIMGWPRRASMSAGVATGGVLVCIGLAALYAAALPFSVDLAGNAQIVSRVSPTLIDLAIALAAGGAGAFALSRPDVGDALPGVAVAIALVPPLAVVGITLQAADYEQAFGALTLFTTNALAIILVGALVFILTGVVPVRRIRRHRAWVRNTAAMLGTVAVITVVLLATTSDQLRSQVFDRDDVELVVEAWAQQEGVAIASADVDRDEVVIVAVGPDRPRDVEQLATDLEIALGRSLVVLVRWIPEEQIVIDGTGP
jgi:uncharacterized hydrophobic protein (TIGR00271 family)